MGRVPDAPGQSRLPTDSLTIATVASGRASAAVKSRPSRSGISNAKAHSQLCYIGKSNNRADRAKYIMDTGSSYQALGCFFSAASSRATISPKPQTCEALPASIAGVTPSVCCTPLRLRALSRGSWVLQRVRRLVWA